MSSIGIRYELSELEYLKVLKLAQSSPPKIESDTFSTKQYMNLCVVVPDDALATYQEHEYWGMFWNLISESEYKSGIDLITDNKEKTEIARYSTNGNIVTSKYKGLVIVRYSDGSTEKIIQK